MVLIYIALVLLVLAWPVVAVGAGVPMILAVLALRGDQIKQERSRALTRAGWLLTVGAALTATAVYGYGLAATTFAAITDPDDRCGVARPDLYGYDHRGPYDGSLSMWPLRDTTCGPDLVPGFVSPLVAGSAVLFLMLIGIMTVARIRSRRRLPATRHES